MNSICRLRIAVAHLGERDQLGWWDTAFLNAIGFRYLQLIFPKTVASASVSAAGEAASREHDERIGKGRVAHLFRLNADMELKIMADLSALGLAELAKLCQKEAALALLDEIAGDAKPIIASGPVHLGLLNDVPKVESHSRLAATYATAFRSGTKIFPYFA